MPLVDGNSVYSLKTYCVIDIQSAISTLKINNLTLLLIIKISVDGLLMLIRGFSSQLGSMKLAHYIFERPHWSS